MRASPKRWATASAIVLVIATLVIYRSNRRAAGDAASAGTRNATTQSVPITDDDGGKLSMSEVLDMARAARTHLTDHLDDYTARFVKQERDASGVLGEEREMLLKVQTRLRGDTQQAPMRVYMQFQTPPSVKGREVIWGEDLYDGKLAVHEVGLLLSLKTIWLDPNGFFAMQGERYPISEIGLVRLVEKLIERGERDRDNPDISVTLSRHHQLGDVDTELIQVRRAKPSGQEEDFSLAEIVIDQQRQLILSYRSFGWPEDEGQQPPLYESYTYYDVKTNVGLADEDFDTANPDYGFP